MSTQQEMFKDSITLGDHYKIWWSYIPHFIHSPGYVYVYAYAELTAFSLFRMYESDKPGFRPLYIELLKNGGKYTPEKLLLPFDLELSDPNFFNYGLDILDALLVKAERQFQKTENKSNGI